ncbi:MAG: hypothetical protein Q9222_007664 [Ikaeria aurantiellina]
MVGNSFAHRIIDHFFPGGFRNGETQTQRAERRARKQKLDESPSALPSRRKNLSQLSLPPVEERRSPLLRLPLEIRLLIYEYSIGGYLLELAHIPKHVVLRKRLSMRPVSVRGGTMAKQFVDREKSYHHLSLVLTCRQLYREAIDTLYSCNTFEVRDPQVWANFTTRCLPPQRLNAIRSLELSWGLPSPSFYDPRYDDCYDLQAWLDCWTIIANKLRLASLKVLLHIPVHPAYPRHDLVIDGEWIRPMLTVKDIQRVRLIWRAQREGTHRLSQEPYEKDRRVIILGSCEEAVVGVMERNGNRVCSRIE